MKMEYEFADNLAYSGCGQEGRDVMEEMKLQQASADVRTEGRGQGEEQLGLEEVRAVLAEKANDGHVAEVKALIRVRGAGRLSEIDPAEYPGLLADAESL